AGYSFQSSDRRISNLILFRPPRVWERVIADAGGKDGFQSLLFFGRGHPVSICAVGDGFGDRFALALVNAAGQRSASHHSRGQIDRKSSSASASGFLVQNSIPYVIAGSDGVPKPREATVDRQRGLVFGHAPLGMLPDVLHPLIHYPQRLGRLIEQRGRPRVGK